jgi:heme-degrading monooxygenase HmoA
LGHVISTRRGLAGAPGLIGYSLAVEIAGTTVWTVSAWTCRAALAAFDRTPAHRSAKSELREQMLPSTLVVWTCPVEELPVSWTDARCRVTSAGRDE